MNTSEGAFQTCKRKKLGFLVGIFWVCAIFFALSSHSFALPQGFVYLEDIEPGILLDLRYSGKDNFMGRPIDGYLKPRCIVTKEMAQALKKIQSELHGFGLGLKIYDSYRPQRAVDHFVRWSKDPNDTDKKDEYYPNIEKESLFREGYIASKSGHSRGSTVDLTIVSIDQKDAGREIDMGSPFDFFDPKSWINSTDISPDQRANRLLLKTIMEKHGFQPYDKEWWHFTLRNEPFPNTYFDFPVK